MAVLTRQGLDSMRKLSTNKTVGAISEIIDNSLQWKREDKDLIVNVCFIQEKNQIKDILISDNGKGMGKDTRGKEIIEYCLAFGGGTNRGAVEGLGKFGMGLPFSSCSQSENYHVYSWQEKNIYKHVYRNHNEYDYEEEIIDKEMSILSNLPDIITKTIKDIKNYQSGTVVIWKDCDSLEFKQAKTLISKIEKNIGRIFRKFIGKNVHIEFNVYNRVGDEYFHDNEISKSIRKFDPLFIDIDTIVSDLGEHYRNNATSEYWRSKETGKIINNRKISFKDSKGEEHLFELTASIAKETTQHSNESKAMGNTPLGKLYEEVSGISLLREDRELKLARFGFPNLKSDPRVKWMKVEVNFKAKSDEIMMVNANKTNADNFRYIDNTKEDLTEDDSDTTKLATLLSKEVSTLISEMYNEIKGRSQKKCANCGTKLNRSGVCPNTNCGNDGENRCIEHDIVIDEGGKCPLCEITEPLEKCPIHKSILVNGECLHCNEDNDNDEDIEEGFIDELKIALEEYTNFDDDINGNKFNIVLDWLKKTKLKYSILYLEKRSDVANLFDLIELPNSTKVKIIAINTNSLFYRENIHNLKEQLGNVDLSPEDEKSIKDSLDAIIYLIVSLAITVDQSVNKSRDSIFLNRMYGNLQELLDSDIDS